MKNQLRILNKSVIPEPTLFVAPERFNARADARSTFREELDVLLRKCRGARSPIRTFGGGSIDSRLKHAGMTLISLTGEKGVALVDSLGMIVTLAALTVGFMANGLGEIQATRNFEARMTAFHLSEGALDQTIVALRTNATYSGLASTTSSNTRIVGNYGTTVTRSFGPK